MIKLLKLELAKNRLKPYWLATACIELFVLGMCFMMGYLPVLEGGRLNGIVQMDETMNTMREWSGFIAMISILSIACFAVMSAVMHTQFTVDEYIGKRAILLFSYPESKGKILFVKCGLVFGFTTITFLVCNITTILIFAMFANAFHILPETFGASEFMDLISMSGISALLTGGIGLIAMRVGFWRKSIIATVVTAVILIAPFGNMLTFFPEQAYLIRIIGMAVFLAIGLFVALGLLSKVNQMEVL